ncbi:MAG TPA: peptidylprolyl isomerase [Geopsychrobacteraceae bacterium]|nr:peptidylprolyl isomerase [Geopsychrobacteraceae bacterium]
MAQVKMGDEVKIDFTGKLEDGTVVDSTLPIEKDDHEDGCSEDGCGCTDSGPMTLKIGDDEFFVPIEEALIGMSVGEKKTVVIPAEDAFGEYDTERVFSVERSMFPDEVNPEVGHQFEIVGEDDEGMLVTVIDIDGDNVSLDSNHPLAGEELIYDFELLEIL